MLKQILCSFFGHDFDGDNWTLRKCSSCGSMNPCYSSQANFSIANSGEHVRSRHRIQSPRSFSLRFASTRSLLSAAILLIVLSPFFAFAAVPTTTGTWQTFDDGVNQTTHSYTFNEDGSGSNLCLIVFLAETNDASSVTWNGTTMNRDGLGTWATANLTGTAVYSLANPATGSHTLTITQPAGLNRAGAAFMTFKNVAQGSPGCTVDVAGAYTAGASAATVNSPNQTGTNTNSFEVGLILTQNTSAEACSPGTFLGTPLVPFSGVHEWGCWRASTGGADHLTFNWTTNSTSDQVTVTYKGSDAVAAASSWFSWFYTPGF